MKKNISLLFLSVFIIVSFSQEVMAAPYFDSVSFYTEHNLTFANNWIYQFGSFVFDDEYDIQSVIAREVTTNQTYVLIDMPTLTGEWIWRTDAIMGTPFLDQLEIIATNTNGDSSSVFTHILDNELRIGIAENIFLSDTSLTPKISWDLVSEAHSYRVRIQDEFGSRIFDSILVGSGNIHDTFYSLPEGILDYDTSYIVRLLADNYGDDGDGIYSLENRSSSYLHFRTASPVPEPSTIILLGSGLAGLVWYGGKRKRR